jgi:hypothetical protein
MTTAARVVLAIRQLTTRQLDSLLVTALLELLICLAKQGSLPRRHQNAIGLQETFDRNGQDFH